MHHPLVCTRFNFLNVDNCSKSEGLDHSTYLSDEKKQDLESLAQS